MTHYRLTDSTPSAIILARNPRTSSLDELKTYQGNDIFLNNGDEFQIRLFNPLTEKIGAQVTINGKSPNRLLVLNPGEVVDVDRFIDEQRRMIFETYKYDDGSQAARNAVAQNGIIQINFHKEYVAPPVYPYYGGTVTTAGFGISGCSTTTTYATLNNVQGMGLPHFRGTNLSAKWSPIIEPTGPQGPNGSGGIIGSAAGGGTTSRGIVDVDNQNNCYHLSADVTMDLNIDNVTLTSGLPFVAPGIYCMEQDLSFVSDEQVQSKSSRKLSKSLKETGRVEKGEKSDQRFKSVDIQFDTFAFHTILYHLKPMSEKNSYVKEVRDYCTTCGYRLRNDKWMFCPKCGEKL